MDAIITNAIVHAYIQHTLHYCTSTVLVRQIITYHNSKCAVGFFPGHASLAYLGSESEKNVAMVLSWLP